MKMLMKINSAHFFFYTFSVRLIKGPSTLNYEVEMNFKKKLNEFAWFGVIFFRKKFLR